MLLVVVRLTVNGLHPRLTVTHPLLFLLISERDRFVYELETPLIIFQLEG